MSDFSYDVEVLLDLPTSIENRDIGALNRYSVQLNKSLKQAFEMVCCAVVGTRRNVHIDNGDKVGTRAVGNERPAIDGPISLLLGRFRD